MYALTLADAERANNRPADGVRIRYGHWETSRRTKSQRLGWTA